MHLVFEIRWLTGVDIEDFVVSVQSGSRQSAGQSYCMGVHKSADEAATHKYASRKRDPDTA